MFILEGGTLFCKWWRTTISSSNYDAFECANEGSTCKRQSTQCSRYGEQTKSVHIAMWTYLNHTSRINMQTLMQLFFKIRTSLNFAIQVSNHKIHAKKLHKVYICENILNALYWREMHATMHILAKSVYKKVYIRRKMHGKHIFPCIF